jgi:hypothetical protein
MDRNMLKSLLLCLVSTSAFALDIPDLHRVHNVRAPQGKTAGAAYCTLASLETLGRIHQIKSLYGAVEKEIKSSPEGWRGHDENVEWKLKSLGVKFYNQRHGNYSTTLLERYADSHGVVVTFKPGDFVDGDHSVVVVEYGEVVYWYDSSRPTSDGPRKLWKASREAFRRNWAGNSIVVWRE